MVPIQTVNEYYSKIDNNLCVLLFHICILQYRVFLNSGLNYYHSLFFLTTGFVFIDTLF